MEPIELAIFLIFSWIPSAIDLAAQWHFNLRITRGMCKKCKDPLSDILNGLYPLD